MWQGSAGEPLSKQGCLNNSLVFFLLFLSAIFDIVSSSISHRQLFLQHLAQTSTTPIGLEIKKAKGIYLYDTSGKKYIDLISGISVSSLGHGHPKVIAAIKNQLNKYMHVMVYGEYIQSPQTQLASLLAKILPKNLSATYFVNSGSEAIEGALKLAKRYTGRTKIIACKNGYHGSTHGSLSLMSNNYFKNAFQPLLPNVDFIEFNNINDIHKITIQTACVVIELVQGEAGVLPAEKNFLKALRKKCTDTGTLLIIDEIQTGCGRTGSMFAFEQYGIIPDVLVLAKAFGGGLPLGAFISSKKIMSALSNNPELGHITTFGGNPVCCAASYATLNALLKEKIIDQVHKKEKIFISQLRHPLIKSIRSKGLLIAVEFENRSINQKIIARCIKNGVITDWFLFNASSMRISPPLVINGKEIKHACKIILNCINEVAEEL